MINATGSRIKELRRKLGIRQNEFANRIKVSPSYVSQVESGKEIPTDKLLSLIAIQYNVSFEWLKNGEGTLELQLGTYDRYERQNNSDAVSPQEEIIKQQICSLVNLFETEAEKAIALEVVSNVVTETLELFSIAEKATSKERTKTILKAARDAKEAFGQDIDSVVEMYLERKK